MIGLFNGLVNRGREMASHATITGALSMPVFVCDPHHPWQHGTGLPPVWLTLGVGGS